MIESWTSRYPTQDVRVESVQYVGERVRSMLGIYKPRWFDFPSIRYMKKKDYIRYIPDRMQV